MGYGGSGLYTDPSSTDSSGIDKNLSDTADDINRYYNSYAYEEEESVLEDVIEVYGKEGELVGSFSPEEYERLRAKANRGGGS